MSAHHIVNVSGGKDSTATYLLALRRGRPFRAVMADTGHEHPWTIDYAQALSERTGGPTVEMVRADFTAEIAHQREHVVGVLWRSQGIPEAIIERAQAALQPTGIPFLDLCLWKGRFPSRMAQFCTEFLKVAAVGDLIEPLRREGTVVQWLGVRRDESLNRRDAPFFQRIQTAGLRPMMLMRPIIHWTAGNALGFARAHGLDPNPLYLQGLGRVGCFPCINEDKPGIAAIGRRFPEAEDRLREWEAMVKAASKSGAATFFAADVTPQGAALVRRLKAQARSEIAREQPGLAGKAWLKAVKARMNSLSADAPWPKAEDVFAWSKTSRGGRQLNMDELWHPDDGVSCSSSYGLCE